MTQLALNLRLIRVECFWGARLDAPCPHTVEAATAQEAHDLMERHYESAHAADIAQALGRDVPPGE